MAKKRKGYENVEDQMAATQRYRNTEAGKKLTKYLNYKSHAKNFVLKYGEKEDLLQLQQMLEKRLNEI